MGKIASKNIVRHGLFFVCNLDTDLPKVLGLFFFFVWAEYNDQTNRGRGLVRGN